MEFFFGWLAEKGVKRIIKVSGDHHKQQYLVFSVLTKLQVIVDDRNFPAHSDEAIENSLRPFVGTKTVSSVTEFQCLLFPVRTLKYSTGEEQTWTLSLLLMLASVCRRFTYIGVGRIQCCAHGQKKKA